jgi:hypothetical protein
MKLILFFTLLVNCAWTMPAYAAADRGAFDDALEKLNREAASGFDLGALIQAEYGADSKEIEWARKQKLAWGEIAALAYIHATTGRSFAEMIEGGANSDFWTYAADAGMNCGKMAQQMDSFFKQTERERNSRIFERLRASRRVHSLPDLGAGFGLFQEALDFRRLDSPRPTKIHTLPGVLAKGEK